MIASKKIREARTSLGWTIDTLAYQAGLKRRTAIGIEAKCSEISPSQKTPQSIQNALESAGIEFIKTDDGGRGVLFRDME